MAMKTFFYKLSIFQLLLCFVLLSFLISITLSLVLVLPRVDRSLRELQETDSRTEVDMATIILEQRIRNLVLSISDLALLPVITNGIMQSGVSEGDIKNFLKNYRINGKDFPLQLLDITGRTVAAKGILTQWDSMNENTWFQKLLSEQNSFAIHLYNTESVDIISIAVPVLYDNSIKGFLLSEIELGPNTPFIEILKKVDRHIILTGGDAEIYTDITKKELEENPERYVLQERFLAQKQLKLTYIFDTLEQQSQRNVQVISVALAIIVGMLIASILLIMIGKRMLINPYKKLADSERKLKTLGAVIENAQDVVMVTDTDLATGDGPSIIYVNPAFEKLSGYSSQEVIGQSPKMLHGESTSIETRASIRKAIAEQQVFHGEILNYTKKGTPYWIEINIFPIFDERGVLIHYGAVERDITEKRAGIHKLQEMSDRLSLATTIANLGVWDMDVPSSELIWDDSMYRLYGLDAKKTKPSYDLWINSLHGEDRQKTISAFQMALDGQGLFNCAFRIMLPNGFIRHLHAIAKVQFDEQARATRIVGINRDITDTRINELHLHRTAEQAEAANRMKSEFLTNMSHEIRTPLNGIIGLTSLLLDQELDADSYHYADMVRKSGEELLILVNDILDLSKMESGKLKIDPHVFDLHGLLADFSDLMIQRCHEKSLEFHYHLAKDLPSYYLGDSNRLRQILNNLCSNAIKFTSIGSITLDISYQAESSKEYQLHFSIKDTGIGIAAEKQKLLFQRFSQADSSTSRKFGGSGLGLAICKQLVELMNGEIGFESVANQGSNFWFKVRLEQAESPSDQNDDFSIIHGKKILVVDDHIGNCEFLIRQLQQWGAEVTACLNATEALDTIKQNHQQAAPYELALLDLHMPGMNGQELGEKIRENQELNNLKLILLPSGGYQGDASVYEQLGFQAYLQKPIRRQDLLDCLLSILKDGGIDSPKLFVTRSYLRDARAYQGRILLVEDNPTNQQVALGSLRRLGCNDITVASHGKEAIVHLSQESFDLVIMDLQMPEMDGLEATRRIRNGQAGPDAIKVPIVAMTANAMSGDREQCIAGGMDDYLAKPISSNALRIILDNWLGPKVLNSNYQPPISISIQEDDSTSLAIFNEDELITRMLGSREMAAGLVIGFIDDLQQLLKDINEYLQQDNLVAVRQTAHTLKGASANMASPQLKDLALQLELAAKKGESQICQQLYQSIFDHIQELKPILEDFSGRYT